MSCGDVYYSVFLLVPNLTRARIMSIWISSMQYIFVRKFRELCWTNPDVWKWNMGYTFWSETSSELYWTNPDICKWNMGSQLIIGKLWELQEYSLARIMRTPWISRKHNEDILKEINLQRELVTHNKRGQSTFFGYFTRWKKLEYIVIEGKLEKWHREEIKREDAREFGIMTWRNNLSEIIGGVEGCVQRYWETLHNMNYEKKVH